MRSPSVVRDSQFANAIYLITKIASISEVKNLLRVPKCLNEHSARSFRTRLARSRHLMEYNFVFLNSSSSCT